MTATMKQKRMPKALTELFELVEESAADMQHEQETGFHEGLYDHLDSAEATTLLKALAAARKAAKTLVNKSVAGEKVSVA